MKLVALELENFRQFYGKQTVHFADGTDGRNVTVVHGYNGAGKTALLNAFIWCLYGETSAAFKMPERVVNELAVDETEVGSRIACSVTLTFERKGELWCVLRDAAVTKTGTRSYDKVTPSLSLTLTKTNGESEPIDRERTDRVKQDRIEQILPKALYPFFFFDGERMEYLARQESQSEVEKGVRTLLDIEVYERGADHLRDHVAKELGKEVRSGSNKQLNDATEKREQKVAEEQRLVAAASELQDKLTALQREIQSQEGRLNTIRELGVLGDQRKILQEQRRSLDIRQNELNRELAGVLSKDGYLAFATNVLRTTEEQVAAARKRGDLPAKVKPQFVDDLLRDHMCICGRAIEPHSDAEDCLTRWKANTGLADLEEQIHNVNAQIRPLLDRRTSMFARVNALLKQLQEVRTGIKANVDEQSAINARLRGGEFGDEARTLKETIDRRHQEVGSTRAQVEANAAMRKTLATEIEDLDAAIGKLKSSEGKSEQARRQLEATQRVAATFAAIRDIQKESARVALDERIRTVWAETTIKDFEAGISETYQLMLTKRVGGQRQPVVGASTGESQVLALAFVGALVAKARENLEANMGEVSGGNVFPLVMDSPFGALGEQFAAGVAQWIPKLANQVIVLVSDTQWRNEVESAINPRVGREYVLEIHSAKQRGALDSQPQRNGIQYVVEAAESGEKTIIREVV